MHSKKEVMKEGEITAFKPEEQSKEPMPLPAGFEWDTFDATDDKECEAICVFIGDHYVESKDFRVIYSIEKFRWAVMTPGWEREYHLLIRNSKNKKIMAIMVGCPKKFIINGVNKTMLEGNFFSIHKKLRSKRLAPIMSQEMFRRQRANGINQTYMTSASTFPTPFARCNYYNKYLNHKKLVDVRYTGLGNLTMQQFIKRYKLPDPKTINIEGSIRVMEKKDISMCFKLF